MSVEALNYPQKGSTALQVLEGVDLAGKHFIITGSNSGIGFETARALAHHNGHVVMACRNNTTANQAREKILDEKKEAQVTVMKLDLTDLESVEAFAQEYLKTDWALHCLILNAGVYATPERTTKNGFETTFQVNHLAQFYLAELLQDRLLKSAPSRVVVLTSGGYGIANLVNPAARLSVDQITWERFSPEPEHMNSTYAAYSLSKFCNLVHAKERNRRMADKGLTAYSVHPGLVNTTLATSTFMKLVMMFGKSPEQGASSSVFCATASGLDKEGGGLYYWDCRPATANPPTAQVQENADKIWELSELMLKQYKEKKADRLAE